MMELNITQPLTPLECVDRFAESLAVAGRDLNKPNSWDTEADFLGYQAMVKLGSSITHNQIKEILGSDAPFAFSNFCDGCEAVAVPLADWSEFTLCRKCLRTAVDLIDGL